MSYKSAACPSCGGWIDKIDRFAAMAVCDYCGGAFYFDDEAVLSMGEMAILTEYPTPFYIGATGKIRKKNFEVVGRVRYRYHSGFWDEWYLKYTDESYGWIADDEMEFSFEHAINNPGIIPPHDQISPGQTLVIADKALIVDERDVAILEGAEGSLPWVLTKDTEFPFVELSQGDDMVTIEYGEDGIEVFAGEFVDADEIKIDFPKEDNSGGWSEA
jgi:Domain of unknown function (DUF4178)